VKAILIKLSVATLVLLAGGVGSPRLAMAMDPAFVCQPADVTVYASRIHIRCRYSFGATNPGFVLLFGDPRFFAVPATDARLTAAAVTLAQAAITSNRSIRIGFDYFDTTGEAYGCQLADCRPIRSLRFDN